MPFKPYLKAIQESIRRGDATEHTHRPAFKDLIQAIEKGITATNEPKRIECGAPDFDISRPTRYGPLTIGYIEAKDVGKSLDEAERSEQIQRYLPLGNLILTDYLEFRWYVDGEHRQTARLGRVGKGGKIVVEKEGKESVGQLLTSFLDRKPPPIDKPKDLAVRLARLTHITRDIIVEAFEKDQASTNLKDLHRAFEEVLIPDLAIPQFADMFAQTLAYGLFAARCNHQGPPESFKRLGAADEIPKTNPFLRRLFDMITGTALDEEPFVGFVDDLVQLLAATEIGAVLADFGKRTRREDPIIHFYETFLAEYNPKERRRRGIYYTPEPVVSYIVRSIDYLLKKHFNCPDGLADTATVEYTREDDEGEKHTETAPRVLVLDPGCGTGTFLYAVVDLIREEFMSRGDAGMWSGYVREHLLPRLFGFELLMAPYAVAHLKLGMQLAGQDLPEAQRKDWAYDFAGDERLGVYLTNTLEEAERRAEGLFGPLRTITEEANAAAKIKRDLPIMVVLGNPPYSVSSANKGPWIMELLEAYKKTIRKEETQIQAVSDDYVKFIRFAQWRIEQTGSGIVGLITNNGYLRGLLFRDMRKALMNEFSDIYILNLHGSTRWEEIPPEGGKDENVFDIQQGVAIVLLVREYGKRGTKQIHYADLWGSRQAKYSALMESVVNSTKWVDFNPFPPLHLFSPVDKTAYEEFSEALTLTKVFGTGRPKVDKHVAYGNGFCTQQDQFAIGFSPDEIESQVEDLLGSANEMELRERYRLCTTNQWDYEKAKEELANSDWRKEIKRCLYRPFDWRHTVYMRAVVSIQRKEIMRHLLKPNVALCTTRQLTSQKFDHIFATSRIVDRDPISLRSKERTVVFPLYLYPYIGARTSKQKSLIDASPWPPGKDGRRPNLSPEFVKDVEGRLGLTFIPDGTGDLKKTFGPEDVFHYMYAIFHSPTYRERYSEFLKIDFPRLPLTSDKNLFADLAEKGQKLVALHLMESPALENRITHYPLPGDHLVEKGHPRYVAPGEKPPGGAEPLTEGRVYISRDDKKAGKRGQYFEGVPPEVWEFHVGGYQVCAKWLKDRRGRNLSYKERIHYQKIVVALKETSRIMHEVDEIIPAWPIK